MDTRPQPNRSRARRRRWCAPLLWLVPLALAGCLDHELPPDDTGGEREVFIALPRDLRDFRDWMSFELRDVDMHAGVAGKVVVYINRLPPPGADVFPVGTIVVKTVEVGDPTSWVVHAMVKRGGMFNAQGAYEWEFFDLAINEDGVPFVLWNGEEPPSGHGYESLPGLNREPTTNDDCNSCHGAASDNDSILSEPLDLDELS